MVELHPNAASEWSAVLDTQTGCVWAYASTPTITASDAGTSKETYLRSLGPRQFMLEQYGPSEYISIPFDKEGRTDFSPALRELVRVQICAIRPA